MGRFAPPARPPNPHSRNFPFGCSDAFCGLWAQIDTRSRWCKRCGTETIRDRVLYSLLFFGLIVIVTTLVTEEVTIGDSNKVVRSVGLGAIRLFGSVFAIFLGIGLVYKELERKTIYTIASKPIPRWMFIVGKYLGLMGVLAVMVAAMGAIYTFGVGLQQGLPTADVYLSLAMLYLELGLLTAWALLFSSYSSPVVASLFSGSGLL